MRCSREKNKENLTNECIDKRKRWIVYRIEVYKEILCLHSNNSFSSMVQILLQQQENFWINLVPSFNLVIKIRILMYFFVFKLIFQFYLIYYANKMNQIILFSWYNNFSDTFKQYKYQNNKMYTEDQLQNLKNTCKTSTYQLQSKLVGDQLEIHLKTTPHYKDYYRYSLNISFQNLQESLREKFENLKNFQAFLSDSNNINVDIKSGVVQLVMSIALLNGKYITSKLGEIKLKENIFDSTKSLEHIIDLCQTRNVLNEGNFKNIVKEFSSMFKILFKKVQKIEGKGANMNMNKQLLSFRLPNIKLGSSSLQNTIKSQKVVYKRKHSSYNEQSQFKSFNQRLHKTSRNIYQHEHQQLDHWKKQITGKLSKMNQKSQQNQIQFDIKIQQLKKQLLTQLNHLRKQSQQGYQFQGLMLSSNLYGSPNKSKLMDRKQKLHKEKQQVDSPLLMSTNQNININSFNFEEKTKKIQSQLRQVKQTLSQFSDIVMKKIQNLGNVQEIFEDKLKKVVQELDIRVEQRILQQAVKQVNNQIIDTSAPYFQQFQLRGTQIQYKGQDSQNTMLLGRIKISEKNSYSIKIIKTLVSNIQIGIVDSKYKNQRDCLSLPNFILYVGWSSTIYEGPNDMKYKQGQAIKQGDIITVIANIENGLIEWYVGGEIRAKYTCQKLKDKSINWVPMIRFYDRGDVISWMTQKMLAGN